jgi:Snf7
MNATRRADLLQGRIAPLDMELARLRREMNAAARGSTSRQRYKDRAKQVLRQKKTLEKRLEQALNQQFNMAMIQDAAEAREVATTDVQLYASIRASLGMAAAPPDVGELRANMEAADDLQRILAEPLDGFSEGMDDVTLEAELKAELEAELGAAMASGASAGLPGSAAPAYLSMSLPPEAQRAAAVPQHNAPVGPLHQSFDLPQEQQSAQDRQRQQQQHRRR